VELVALAQDQRNDLRSLFFATFSASEGQEEGERIGDLASQLSDAIDDAGVMCFGALQSQSLIGAVFCTRLTFDDTDLVYMLAPVAVAPAYQGVGVGTSLLTFALNAIAGMGAVVAVTYGDPAFYRRVGFAPLSERVLPAPMQLTMPLGWLGQSLTEKPIQVRRQPPRCVAAFRHPAYW
jgi:putative acetyltransferase